MQGKFLRPTPLKFLEVIGEHAHEFLTNCCERLYTLDLVDSKGVYYMVNKLA